MPEQARTWRRPPLWLILTTVLAAIALLAVGTWLYAEQEKAVSGQAESELESIARLKVDQIATWRSDRLAEGRRIRSAAGLRQFVLAHLSEPTSQTTAALSESLSSLHYGDRYYDVLLATPDGTVLMAASSTAVQLHPPALDALQRVVDEGQTLLTDLHRTDEGRVHIDIIAPVFASADEAAPVVAAVVLQADAGNFLFPLIQTWPTRSATGETLLVERVGDEVVFLNDLRHVENEPFGLVIPLDRADVPAVQAVLGTTGIVRGTDYRGEPVIAYVAPIPDSPWFMVSKMDTSEALSEWRGRAWLVVALTVLLMASAMGIALVTWQRMRIERTEQLLRAEQAVDAAEARLRVTLESVGDGIISTDERGLVEFMNPVAETLTGWQAHEATGRQLEDVLKLRDEETGEELECPSTRILRDGVTIGLADHTLLVCRDGTERPIADSGAPIRDRAGTVSGVVVVFRDQTLERAAQRALAESLDRYQRLFNSMLDGFAVHELAFDEHGEPIDYVFLGVNPAFEHLTGLRADEVAGRRASEVLPGLEPEWLERYAHVAQTGIAARFEQHSRVLGKTFDCYAFRASENQFAVVFRDVTEERRLEAELDAHRENLERLVKERTAELHDANEELALANEELAATNEELQATADELESTNAELRETADELQRANEELLEAGEAKNRFVRSMSHELRTPLNSVIGFSDLMMRDTESAISEEERHQLEIINHSGRHLLEIINDILDLSRIVAGKEQVDAAEFEVASLGGELLDSVRADADGKGLDLRLELPEGSAPATMVSDRRKVQQILLNLLGNAIKFTETGSVTLRITRAAPNIVGFAVVDTGPGIPESERETIFAEFERGDAAIRSSGEGTGLGLTISRHLAGLLGGSLSVRSQVGAGSTFTLLLPDSIESSEPEDEG